MARIRNGAHLIPGTVHTIQLDELFAILRKKTTYQFSSETRESDEWNGNMAFDEAMRAAEFGQWSAPKIDALILPDVSGVAEDSRYFYDVIGNTLDVPAYVSGEPEYWLTEETIEKPCGRIFRLAIEVGGMGSVEALSLANRSKAIVALINSLELAGHSVELTIVRACRNKAGENFRFLIPVKAAGQALDVKRIQFMCGHPAFYRRLIFGLVEIAQGKNLDKCSTSTQNYKPEGYIHIPFEAGLKSTLAASLQWAESFAHSLSTQN